MFSGCFLLFAYDSPSSEATLAETVVQETEAVLDSAGQIDQLETVIYGDGSLEERMDAVYSLMELDYERGVLAAYTVFTGIDYSAPDFWNYGIPDSGAKLLYDMITILSAEGYDNIAAETVTKLCAADAAGLELMQRNTIHEALKEHGDLFETLTPLLITGGWFDRENNSLDLDHDTEPAVEKIEYLVNAYIGLQETTDGKLSAAYFVNANITPITAERYGKGVTGFPVTVNAHRGDLSGKMPELTNDTQHNDKENAKYLIVYRATGSDSDHDWKIDFDLQVLLPPELAPKNLAEVTHLITMDFTWEYAFTYDNDITKAYTANIAINVYSYLTGKLLDKVRKVQIYPASTYFYYGNTPDVVYAQPVKSGIYEIFKSDILDLS
jgi:hypothetical protein